MQALVRITGAMGVDNAMGGTCHYMVGNGDFSNPGTYLAHITASYGTELISWGGFQIVILPVPRKAIN
jgi:hypothetical protein